jgi:hypothetical protein
MTDEELDNVLAEEGQVVPSSGFVASVMEAVRREASTPPPIPFPWTRALPGLAVCVAILVLAAAAGIDGITTGGLVRHFGQLILHAASALAPTARMTLGWISAAMLLTWGLVALSMRLTGWNR